MSNRKVLSRSHTAFDQTVEDIVDWCIQRDLNPKDVRLAGMANLRWVSEETEAERLGRERFDAEREQRMISWEKDTLKRLKEKYGE